MCAVRVDSNINIRQIVGHLGAIDWYLDSAHVHCTEEFLKAVAYPPWTPLMLPAGHKLGIDGIFPSLYEDISLKHKIPDGMFQDPIDMQEMRKFSCLQSLNFWNDATRTNVGASAYGQFLYLEPPDSPEDEVHQMMDIMRGGFHREGLDAAIAIRDQETRLAENPDGQSREDSVRILEEMRGPR